MASGNNDAAGPPALGRYCVSHAAPADMSEEGAQALRDLFYAHCRPGAVLEDVSCVDEARCVLTAAHYDALRSGDLEIASLVTAIFDEDHEDLEWFQPELGEELGYFEMQVGRNTFISVLEPKIGSLTRT